MKRSLSMINQEDSVHVSNKAPHLCIPGVLSVDLLRTHAGVATNLGRLLYNEGDYVTAMCLYQESLQALLCLEAATKNKNKKSVSCYFSCTSEERHKELVHLLSILASKADRPETRKTYCAAVRRLFIVEDKHTEGHFNTSAAGGFPGLLKRNYSKLSGDELLHLAGLTFSEPFRVDLDIARGKLPVDEEEKHFIIPLEECPKATLFNMALIHYHWGCVDKALQFFDLASTISHQLSPLAFDPIVLASFNNMAQIHFQYGRTGHAMELLQDALTRGNAALSALYGEKGADWNRCSRRLRRKLARTTMNICQVHYINCEYEAAMTSCHDALELLHPHNTGEPEAFAISHNIGVLLYHQGKKQAAVQHLERFIHSATKNVGPDHLQLAEAYELVGKAVFELGKWNESMTPLNEALRIRQLKLESDHPSVAESLCAMGRVWLAREEYDICTRAFEKGIKIFRAAAGTNVLSFEAAQTLLDMGRAFHAQNRTEEAVAIYQEALEWTCKFFGSSSAFVVRLMNILGNLRLELSHVDKAMELFVQEAKTCLEEQLPLNYNVVKDPIYHTNRAVPSAAATA